MIKAAINVIVANVVKIANIIVGIFRVKTINSVIVKGRVRNGVIVTKVVEKTSINFVTETSKKYIVIVTKRDKVKK